MKKNDCFLMMGSNINEPMTLYYITDVCNDKSWAKSICISKKMVQGLEFSDKYDDYEIPDDAIMLPGNAYDWVKGEMQSFLDDIYAFLNDSIVKNTANIEVGHHYVGHDDIQSITEIGDKKVYYNVFKLEIENISPYWTGESPRESFNSSSSITNETHTILYSENTMSYFKG